MSRYDKRRLAKSLKGIDLNCDKMIQREEMFHFVANLYTSAILTEKEDLKKLVKQTIANSKFPIYI